MNKFKDFFIELLGGAGVIAYYIIKIAVVALPFIFIDVPLWATLIIIVVVYFIPYLTPVVWIWGLISAINSPQDWFSYVFYVVFVLYVIMFVISLFRRN